MTEYQVFAAFLFGGLFITFALLFVRIAGASLPWLLILAPGVAGWIVATWPWVHAVLLFHRNSEHPVPWANVSLALFLSLVGAVVVRALLERSR